MKNAYDSLVRISKQFNISVVDKTFGKGIIRVSCRTIMQLDNISLIMKELVKFNLIVEVGMEPLAYSDKMNSSVVYFKPTDLISSQKLDYVFGKYFLTFLKYNHLVIDVDYPVAKKGSFNSKRIAVKKAYFSLPQILNEFNIQCVKRTFGSGILRVCCSSVVQFDNITLIMKKLLKLRLIEEIGMPLEYFHKMKSLVLFIKPMDAESSKKLYHMFQKCSFKYHNVLLDIKSPNAPAKETFQVSANLFFESPKGLMIIRVIKIISIVILYKYFRI